MKTSLITIIVVAALLGGGYYFLYGRSAVNAPAYNPNMGSNTQQLPKPSASVPAPTTASQTATFTLKTLADKALGMVLVADNGMTLYTYAPDTSGVSNCSGACAVAWPPYTVSASQSQSLTAAAGISGKIATIARSDGGALQVTYDGKPLYYFAKDVKVGDTLGQGVGGVWFVVKP